MRRTAGRILLSIGVVALLGAAAGGARLEGRVVLDVPGLALADVGEIVVYLDAPGVAELPAEAPPVIRQKAARFAPSFLAVARGQSIDMLNDDGIFHNVFSFSAPNDFDLGLYASGRSRSVRFDHPGPVRIYCSIHEDMAGTIFVSPTPWFTQLREDGTFQIDSVPPGDYVLRTWTPVLPETAQRVAIRDRSHVVSVVIRATSSSASGSAPPAE